jgi:hypothetical protein
MPQPNWLEPPQSHGVNFAVGPTSPRCTGTVLSTKYWNIEVPPRRSRHVPETAGPLHSEGTNADSLLRYPSKNAYTSDRSQTAGIRNREARIQCPILDKQKLTLSRMSKPGNGVKPPAPQADPALPHRPSDST